MAHFSRRYVLTASMVVALSALGLGGTASASKLTSQSVSPTISPRMLGNYALNAADLRGGTNITGKTIVFQIYTPESTSFFVPTVTGAKAAAALMGLHLDLEYSNSDDTTQVDQLHTAIASHVAGIAASLPDGATDKVVCAAEAAHIPVITFNVDGLTGNATHCVEAFIGQNFVSAGQVIAQRMVSVGAIKKGDHVFCPVESTTASYAPLRYEGVMDVLKKIGATCSELAVGFGDSGAETTMVDYLLGHRNTNAILALGSTPLTVAVAAVQKAGLQKSIGGHIGGFDLTDTILSNIQKGQIIATVDQQPYSQGFFAVLQLALQLKYALYPSGMNTGGTGLIDSSNISKVLKLVPTYR